MSSSSPINLGSPRATRSPATVSRLQGLPPDAIQHILATAEALELGHADAASRRIAPLLATSPRHPEVMRLQAGILSQLGNHRAALAVMQQAIAQRPDDPLYHNTLGTILGAGDDLDEAIVALRRACQLQPELAVAWYNLGVMLTHCVRHEEAIDALRHAITLNPQHMEARALLGDMLRTEGRTEEATKLYRQMLAERPTSGMAWWGLADIKTTRFSEDDITNIRSALQAPSVGNDDLVPMGFALAKALDDHGRYQESLAALMTANTVACRRIHWRAASFSAGVDGMLKTFSCPIAFAPDPDLGREVTFIVGLPRSGSTLVEQILASHPAVQGTGELPDVPLTLTAESQLRGSSFPDWAIQATARDWQRLGLHYMERTAYWREQRPCFADKLPSNWMYIGAIRSMLPAAKIIACRRDPLETCFSCYRQYLAGNDYARTFRDLAAFWIDYDRSIKFWREHAPHMMYEHSYEQLIADPEQSIRALLDFCGLPFEDSCLRFYENQREVRSPSATQVRQPLRGDTARSAQYGALLDPLRAALGLPLFGRASPDPQS